MGFSVVLLLESEDILKSASVQPHEVVFGGSLRALV
jgi:hypothetical protein